MIQVNIYQILLAFLRSNWMNSKIIAILKHIIVTIRNSYDNKKLWDSDNSIVAACIVIEMPCNHYLLRFCITRVITNIPSYVPDYQMFASS